MTIESRRSGGPRTDAGKLASSKNSLKHGLFTQVTVLPGEDADSFRQLFDGLVELFEPTSLLEVCLVEKIAVSLWRLRRLVAWETAVEYSEACRRARIGPGLPAPFNCRLDGRFQEQLARLHAGVDSATYKAMGALHRQQSWRARGSEPAPPNEN